MTRAEILALIERRQAAANAHDVEALTLLHAEDGVVESPMAGTHQGREAIGEVYRAFSTAFPDAAFTTDDVIVDGDRAVLLSTVSGTDTGGFMGLPPTRKQFKMQAVLLYAFKDDHIAHERRIYDFTGLLVQIGVLKARPA